MTPHSSTDYGHHALLCAICHQAIQDYFLLRRAGAIRWGKAIPVAPRAGHMSYVVKDISYTEVAELVEFMSNDMHRLLCMVGMNVTRMDVHRSLHKLERTEDWKTMFNRETNGSEN
jgi:hypothetical protein